MSSINKTENYNLSQFGNDDIPDWRTDYSGDMMVIDEELKRLNDEVVEVKKSVSDGKEMLAAAITGKGIETASNDSFSVMAENVGKIESGSSFDSAIVSVDKFMINTSTLGCNVYLGEEE